MEKSVGHQPLLAISVRCLRIKGWMPFLTQPPITGMPRVRGWHLKQGRMYMWKNPAVITPMKGNYLLHSRRNMGRLSRWATSSAQHRKPLMSSNRYTMVPSAIPTRRLHFIPIHGERCLFPARLPPLRDWTGNCSRARRRIPNTCTIHGITTGTGTDGIGGQPKPGTMPPMSWMWPGGH